MLLSIIIPVFNNLHFTKQALESIEENISTDDYEIIIIDNGSTDGTQKFLSNYREQPLRLVHLPVNIFVNPAWSL